MAKGGGVGVTTQISGTRPIRQRLARIGRIVSWQVGAVRVRFLGHPRLREYLVPNRGGAKAPAEMLRRLLMLLPREGTAPVVMHYRLLILLRRVGPAPAAMRGRLLGDPVREGDRVLWLWRVEYQRTYHSPCQWAELLS